MERRSEARLSIVLPAQIVAPGLSLGCTVYDISDHGARIRVNDARLVPEFFDLYVDPKQRRAAAILWRGVEELGVAFLPERPRFGRRTIGINAS